MNTYYVSLVQDLIGVYLIATADSEMAVRLYLNNMYKSQNGDWKLPWCSIYATPPDEKFGKATLLRPRNMRNLVEANELAEFQVNQQLKKAPVDQEMDEA